MASLIDLLKKYAYVGLRTLCPDEHYQVGDVCRNSYAWDFVEDCSSHDTDNPRQLNGTCALDCGIEDYDLDAWPDEAELLAELATTVYNYGDGQKVLIAGDYATRGDDPAEIIIENAVVIYIFES